MRLLVAATLLSQALPAAPKDSTTTVDIHNVVSSESKIISDRFLGVQRGSRIMQSMLENLAAGQSATIVRQSRMDTASVLRNKHDINFEDLSAKECDPTSDDPDIGILSCGVGQFCETRHDTLLGGRCSSTTTIERDLAYSNPLSGIPCSPTFALQCTCPNFNLTTLSGSFQCIYQLYSCIGCGAYCYAVNVTATEEFKIVKKLQFCYIFKKPYQIEFCYTGYFPTTSGLCKYTINGVDCNSCSKNSFDCTNVPNGSAATTRNGAFPLPIMKGLNHTLTVNATCAPGNSTSTPGTPASTSTKAPSAVGMTTAPTTMAAATTMTSHPASSPSKAPSMVGTTPTKAPAPAPKSGTNDHRIGNSMMWMVVGLASFWWSSR